MVPTYWVTRTLPVIPVTASGSRAVCLGGDPGASLRLGKGDILPFLHPDRHTPFRFKMLLLRAAARGGSPSSVARRKMNVGTAGAGGKSTNCLKNVFCAWQQRVKNEDINCPRPQNIAGTGSQPASPGQAGQPGTRFVLELRVDGREKTPRAQEISFNSFEKARGPPAEKGVTQGHTQAQGPGSPGTLCSWDPQRHERGLLDSREWCCLGHGGVEPARTLPAPRPGGEPKTGPQRCLPTTVTPRGAGGVKKHIPGGPHRDPGRQAAQDTDSLL